MEEWGGVVWSGGMSESEPLNPVYILVLSIGPLVGLLGRGLYHGGPFTVPAAVNQFTVAGILKGPLRYLSYLPQQAKVFAAVN